MLRVLTRLWRVVFIGLKIQHPLHRDNPLASMMRQSVLTPDAGRCRYDSQTVSGSSRRGPRSRVSVTPVQRNAALISGATAFLISEFQPHSGEACRAPPHPTHSASRSLHTADIGWSHCPASLDLSSCKSTLCVKRVPPSG